jgi:hypothetical protein
MGSSTSSAITSMFRSSGLEKKITDEKNANQALSSTKTNQALSSTKTKRKANTASRMPNDGKSILRSKTLG